MSDKYGSGQDGQYCYPNSDVLINKLGLDNERELEAAEIALTQARIDQYEPNFDDFSLAALQAIHFHLFQDIYYWAGEIRTVDISKGSTRFANISRIEAEGEKLFRQLAQEGYLSSLSRAQFVERLAHYYSELNVIHPFRDGNGRTQRLMFEGICINAGFEVRWEPIGRSEWVEANINAFYGRLELLTELLDRAVTPI